MRVYERVYFLLEVFLDGKMSFDLPVVILL